mgnify:CR=1 FL=1
MGYQLSFNQIWRNFDKLTNGVILSLELAFIAILIGALIGLTLAVIYVSSGRVVRTVISAYVEFIRNVPLLLLVYLVFYGLPTVVFRQSCIYGPRQMGVEDQGWLAWFVIAIITGRPITIYGNGKQVRDLLYVDDLVNAFELAVEHIDATAGEVYNIGGGAGRAISVWQEFKPLVEAALGRPVPEPAYGEMRPGDQPIFIADTGKAERDFGWSPKVTPREGIGMMVDWVEAKRSLFASFAQV